MRRFLNKKRLIAFILVLTLSFVIIGNVNEKRTEAYSMSLATGVNFVAGGTAVSISAPVVASILVIAIGMGLYFNNQEEINSFIINLYNKAVSKGKDILSFFKEGLNSVTVSKDGLNTIHDSIVSDTFDTTLSSGTFPLVYVADGSPSDYINGYYKNAKLISDIESGQFYHFVINNSFQIQNGQSLSDIGVYNQQFRLTKGSGVNNFYSISGIDNVYHVFIDTTTSKYRALCLTNTKYKSLSNSALLDEIKYSGRAFDLNLFNEFTISSFVNVNGLSVTVDRLFGDSIGNTQNVSHDGFLDDSLSKDKDISVNIPITSDGDIALDSVIGKTYDDVISSGVTLENTGDATIPGETPGIIEGIIDGIKSLVNSILDVLNSILSFLTGLLETLINAFISMFTSLFVPTVSISDLFSVPDGSGFGAILDLFNFDKVFNITPKAYEFSTNIDILDLSPSGNDRSWGIKINIFDNEVVKNNIDLVRNILSYSLLLGVIYFIVYHFLPKRDMD